MSTFGRYNKGAFTTLKENPKPQPTVTQKFSLGLQSSGGLRLSPLLEGACVEAQVFWKRFDI